MRVLLCFALNFAPTCHRNSSAGFTSDADRLLHSESEHSRKQALGLAALYKVEVPQSEQLEAVAPHTTVTAQYMKGRTSLSP
jgi:hypothetical protein